MKKMVCLFGVMLGQTLVGVGSQGTHLDPVRESDEFRAPSSLRGSNDFKLMDALKTGNNLRYSSLPVKSQLALLHSTEEYQVVAAWLQTKWLQNDTVVFERMENSDRWKMRGERVKRLLYLLVQMPVAQANIAEIYEQCFHKTDLKDRCVPGCGNNRRALINPERFVQRIGSSKVSS